MYLEDILSEDYTLMDVAYIYAWRRVCTVKPTFHFIQAFPLTLTHTLSRSFYFSFSLLLFMHMNAINITAIYYSAKVKLCIVECIASCRTFCVRFNYILYTIVNTLSIKLKCVRLLSITIYVLIFQFIYFFSFFYLQCQCHCFPKWSHSERSNASILSYM
jgi:hypothetical protein